MSFIREQAPSGCKGKAYDNSSALQTRVGWVPVIRLDYLSFGVGHGGGCHIRPLDSKYQRRTLSSWTFVGWIALTIRGGSGVVPWWWVKVAHARS